MKEIRDLAAALAEIASLRKAHGDARAAIATEVERAHVNVVKVQSLVQGLKDSNKEVESFLAESGSNFEPNLDEVYRSQGVQILTTADINGVTLTSGSKK